MNEENNTLKDLLKPKQSKPKLVKSTHYLTEEQREKLEHFAGLANCGISEYLRDILDTVFFELEKEEQKEKADDDSSPT